MASLSAEVSQLQTELIALRQSRGKKVQHNKQQGDRFPELSPIIDVDVVREDGGLTDRELIELEGISERTLRDWKSKGRSPTHYANNKQRERLYEYRGSSWYRS